MAIWNKRSEHDLVGNGIGVSHGQWLQPGFSGVGAGIDSFFEYGMKAAILLSESRSTALDNFTDMKTTIRILTSSKTRMRQSKPTSALQMDSS